MLRYSDDRRYIIQKNARTGKITKTLGPYEPDMLPEIHNSDETDRNIVGIPEPDESVYDIYPNLRLEFIRFTDLKYSNLTLKDVKPGCNYKVEFKCNTCGHKWITVLESRTKIHTGCVYCCKTNVSFPEKYIFYCLKQVDSNLQENYRISNSQLLEFDMYDPFLKFAIEFSQGMYHQSRIDEDENKLEYALSQNIRLIRIWQLNSEKQVSKLKNDEYIVPDKRSINGVPDLNIVIDDICKQYKLNQSLIDRQAAQSIAFLRTNQNPPEGQSLKDQYPNLCRDWDYSKNGVIRPEMLKPGSGIKVWWTCFYCGKTWQSQVQNRTASDKSLRAGCKTCNTKIGLGLMQEIPYIPAK